MRRLNGGQPEFPGESPGSVEKLTGRYSMNRIGLIKNWIQLKWGKASELEQQNKPHPWTSMSARTLKAMSARGRCDWQRISSRRCSMSSALSYAMASKLEDL